RVQQPLHSHCSSAEAATQWRKSPRRPPHPSTRGRHMKLPKIGVALAALVLLAGYAGWANAYEGMPSVDRRGAPALQEAPIRVLVVTATHGFRHTEGIDASKAFLQEAAGT